MRSSLDTENRGLLDDAAYAAGRVASLHRRGDSLKAIRARLAGKGVPADVAAEAVSGLRESCLRSRHRRGLRLRPSPPARTVSPGGGGPARELGAFARAGFSRRVAEAVLACGDVEAAEALARDGLC